MANRPNSGVQQWEVTSENRAAVPGQRKIEIPGSNQVTRRLAIP